MICKEVFKFPSQYYHISRSDTISISVLLYYDEFWIFLIKFYVWQIVIVNCEMQSWFFLVKTILCFKFEVGLDLDKNLKTWIYLAGFQLPIQSLDFTPILSKKSLNVLFVCSFKTKSWFLFFGQNLEKTEWLELIGYLLQKWLRKKTISQAAIFKMYFPFYFSILILWEEIL